MLVRPNEKLVAISPVLIAAASAAGTHEDAHLEDVARVWEDDKNASIVVSRGLDPSVVHVARAPRAVFVDRADGKRRTGRGRRGRSSLGVP
jgi:hypothetical protein